MFKVNYIKALDDYKKARRRAEIEELLSRITGREEQTSLLSYEEVRQQLRAIEKSTQRLVEIPLDAIVGSVGRYHDFTRKYLPKSSIDQQRWARVMATTQSMAGLPPIEVYQIGDVYFVKDGNHRVSVARQMGNDTIQAYVTILESKVDIEPDTTPDDLIIKSEQVKFLEMTELDQLRPGSDLSATKAGAYPTLLEHIAVHRYYMGLDQQREIPFREAAAEWYDRVFTPAVSLIKKRDLLKDFPDRTATDLYLWTSEHRASLEEHLGWKVGQEDAISDLSELHGKRSKNLLRNTINKIRKFVAGTLGIGPPPGTWRERLAGMSVLKHLFSDLIVALDDSKNTWNALDLAIRLSKLEDSHIHGIHIHPQDSDQTLVDHDTLNTSFQSRCQQAGIYNSDFIVSSGDIGTILCEHSRFADLILLPLNHPPGEKPFQKISSGLAAIIRSCPVPILTVPDSPQGFSSIILAFDGSPKSWEAMYIAAYFGSQHGSELTILTSSVGLSHPETVLEQAKSYLTRFPATCNYVLSDLPVSRALATLQEERKADLVMIGGYGGNIFRDVMLGSVVDSVLQEIHLPILVCR